MWFHKLTNSVRDSITHNVVTSWSTCGTAAVNESNIVRSRSNKLPSRLSFRHAITDEQLNSPLISHTCNVVYVSNVTLVVHQWVQFGHIVSIRNHKRKCIQQQFHQLTSSMFPASCDATTPDMRHNITENVNERSNHRSHKNMWPICLATESLCMIHWHRKTTHTHENLRTVLRCSGGSHNNCRTNTIAQTQYANPARSYIVVCLCRS